MNTINRIEYKYIDLKVTTLKSDDIYNSFFEWMGEAIGENKKEVIEKELKYLKQPYDEEEHEILSRLESRDNWYKLVRFSRKNTKDFKAVINDMKEIHEFFNDEDYEEKGYNHYNRLLSWYTVTPKNVDKIIDNIIEHQKNKKAVKYRLVSTIEDVEFNNKSYVCK